MEDFDVFTDAYVEAMLWSTTDDDGDPLDDNYDARALAPETLKQILEDCERFQEENAKDLVGIDPASAGHDFWLTRTGHGLGFWDRGLGDVGERLTAAAHAFGNLDPYAGDDGKLYF